MPSETAQIDADPFLQLLTDALRDGPGSPPWHEAVKQLNAKSAAGEAVDEFRLLCQAREHLESGKQYRSVQPGPVFMQRVMTAIDSGESKRIISLRHLIMAVSACGIVLAAAVLIWKVTSRNGGEDPDVAALSAMVFAAPRYTLDVDRQPRDGWQVIGSLPLRFDHGIHGWQPGWDHRLPMGGGMVLPAPINADEPFEIDARLALPHLSDDVILEIVIADTNDFSKQMAASSHELVWALQGEHAKVILPDGRLAAQADCHPDSRSEVTVRVRINQRAAIIDNNGHAMWSGPIGLSPTNPRFVAIRFLQRGPANPDAVIVRSFRLLVSR